MNPVMLGRLLRHGWPWLMGALLFAGGLLCGMSAQKQRNAAVLTEKDAALREAAAQLTHAADALRQQNAAYARMVEQMRHAERREAAARNAADAELVRLRRESQSFERRLAQAQRRATCKALLETDVRQACGALF